MKCEVIDKISKWETMIRVDPFYDSKIVFTYLYADYKKSSHRRPIILTIACESEVTAMCIDWNDYLESEQILICINWDTSLEKKELYIPVLTRIGSDKAEKKKWSLSTDNQSIFYPNSPISYLKRMMESNKFLARIKNSEEEEITAIFDTTGMKKALEPIRKECGW